MASAIELYKKSLERSAAQAEAEVPARATEAEERVKTTRDTEEAKRRRAVDTEIAEKAAAETRIAAEAEKIRAAVQAEAQRLLNEAENVLTDDARYSLFRRKLLEHVEGIVAASVKPLEKIQDIRIMQLDGVGGAGRRLSRLAHRRGHRLGAALPRPGADARQPARRHRHRRLHHRQAGRPDPRGPRHDLDGRATSAAARAAAAQGRAAATRLPATRAARPAATMAPVAAAPAAAAGGGADLGARLHLQRHRRRGAARSGSACATSTACRTGTRAIRDSRIENAEPSDRVGCVRDFHLQNGDRLREKLLGL